MKKYISLVLSLFCATALTAATTSVDTLLSVPSFQGYDRNLNIVNQTGTPFTVATESYAWAHTGVLFDQMTGWYSYDPAEKNYEKVIPTSQGAQQFTYTFWANPMHDMKIGLLLGDYCIELIIGGWDTPGNHGYWTNKDQHSALFLHKLTKKEKQVGVGQSLETATFVPITEVTETLVGRKEYYDARLLEPRGGTAQFFLTVLQSPTDASQWTFSIASLTPGSPEPQELFRFTQSDIANLSQEVATALSQQTIQSIGFRTQGQTNAYVVANDALLKPGQLTVEYAQNQCSTAQEMLTASKSFLEKIATDVALGWATNLKDFIDMISQMRSQIVVPDSFATFADAANLTAGGKFTLQAAHEAQLTAVAAMHAALADLLSTADANASTLITQGYPEEIQTHPATGTKALITQLAQGIAPLQQISQGFPEIITHPQQPLLIARQTQETVATAFSFLSTSLAPQVTAAHDKIAATLGTSTENTDSTTLTPIADPEETFAKQDLNAAPELSLSGPHNVTTGEYAWFGGNNFARAVSRPASGPQQFEFVFWANPTHDLTIGLKSKDHCSEFVIGGWDQGTNGSQRSAVVTYEISNNELVQKRKETSSFLNSAIYALPEPRGATVQFTLTVIQSPTDSKKWFFGLSYIHPQTHERKQHVVFTQSLTTTNYTNDLAANGVESIAFRAFTQGTQPYEYSVANTALKKPSELAIKNAQTLLAATTSHCSDAETLAQNTSTLLSSLPSGVKGSLSYGQATIGIAPESTEGTSLKNAAQALSANAAEQAASIPTLATVASLDDATATTSAADTATSNALLISGKAAATAHRAAFVMLSALDLGEQKLQTNSSTGAATLLVQLEQATKSVAALLEGFPYSLPSQTFHAHQNVSISNAITTYMAILTTSLMPKITALQQELAPRFATLPEDTTITTDTNAQGSNVQTYNYAWSGTDMVPNFSYDLGSFKKSPQLFSFSFTANPVHDMIIGLKMDTYVIEMVLGGWDTVTNQTNNNNNDQRSALLFYEGTRGRGQINLYNSAEHSYRLPEPRAKNHSFTVTVHQSSSNLNAITITISYLDAATGKQKEMVRFTETEINQYLPEAVTALASGSFFSSVGFRTYTEGPTPFAFTVSNPQITVPGEAVRSAARTALTKAQSMLTPLDASAQEVVAAAQALPAEATNKSSLISQAQALRNNPTEGTLALLNTIASYLEQLAPQESYTPETLAQSLTVASESYTLTKPLLENTQLKTNITQTIAAVKEAIAQAQKEAQAAAEQQKLQEQELVAAVASYTLKYQALISALTNDIQSGSFATAYNDQATALNSQQETIDATITALTESGATLLPATRTDYNAYVELVNSGALAAKKAEWDTALQTQQDAAENDRIAAEEKRNAEATVMTGNYSWFAVDESPNTVQSLSDYQQAPQQVIATFTANPVHDMMIGLKIKTFTLEFIIGGWDSTANVANNTNKDQRSAVTIIEGTRDTVRKNLTSPLPEPRGAYFTFTLSIMQNRQDSSVWDIAVTHESNELARITSDEIQALSPALHEAMSTNVFESIGFRTFTQGTKPFAFAVKDFSLAPSQEALDVAKAAEEEAARLAAQKAAEEAAQLQAEQELAAQKRTEAITAIEADANAYVTQYNELIAALEKDIADKTFVVDFVAKATALNTMQEALDARVEELGDTFTPSTDATPSYMTYQTTIASNAVVTKKAEWDAALKAQQEANAATQKASDEYSAAIAKIEADATAYMAQYDELLAALKNDIATQTFETDFIAKATALNTLQEGIEDQVDALGDTFAPTTNANPAYMKYDAATDGTAIIDAKEEWDTAFAAKQIADAFPDAPTEIPTLIGETATETPEQPAAQQAEQPAQEQPAPTENSFAKGTLTPATAMTNNSASFAVKSGMGITIILTDSTGAQHRIGLGTQGTQLYPYGQTTPDGGLQASRVTLPNDLQEHPFVVRGDLSDINDDGESKYRLNFTVTATRTNTDDVLSYDVPAPANPEQFALNSYQVTSDTGAFSFTAKEAPNDLPTPSAVSTAATSMEQVQKAFDAYTQEPNQATKSKLSDTHQASLDDTAYRMSELRVKVVQALR
jgi:hypothetical protein